MTSFSAVPTRSTRVRVIYSEPMRRNAALTDRRSYTLMDMAGTALSVSSATAEQASTVLSVVLELGSGLVGGAVYQLKVSNTIVSVPGAAVSPDPGIFRWIEGPLSVQIPLALFSGKASGGLYGAQSSVFFSPALQRAAPNSIIKVDQVDVCSTAYDEYHVPLQSDDGLRPLMTYDPLLTRVMPLTTLNSTDVLQGSQGVVVNARFTVSPRYPDALPSPVDSSPTTSMVAWPAARVALLNNLGWKLFDNIAATSPAYFVVADNLTALSQLPPVTRTL